MMNASPSSGSRFICWRMTDSTLSYLHRMSWAVLDVLLGGVQAGDLGAHLLGNSQTGGVIAGAVDLVAGGHPSLPQ